MKKLLTILLLSLFSHTLLWGQDTIKFELLEVVDTIYNKQAFDSLNRIDNWNFDTLMILEKCEDEFDDSHCYREYFIVVKQETYYVRYILPYNNSNNMSYIDSTSIKIQNNILSYEAHDSYQFTSSVDFFIVDLIQMTYYGIGKYFTSVFDVIEDEEGFRAYYGYEIKSEINFDGKKLLISNTECYQDEDYPIPKKGPCYEGENHEGEYHYINGNFIKVKTYINKHTFTNTAYDIGEKTYLTPECTFYFECDCCFDQLLFTSDSTFIVVSPCTEETSVSHGRYEVKDNMIYLHYSGIWKNRYMISDEQDKGTEFAIKTYTTTPRTEVYAPEVCKNTNLFSEQTKPDIKMLCSEETLESKLTYLKSIGLLD